MSEVPGTFFRRWVLVTALGWLLGLALLIGLAVLWDLIGTAEAQFMVGLGLGAGVGLLQTRILAPWLRVPNRWMWASALGMGIPFLIYDLAHAAGYPLSLSPAGLLPVGALIAGLWQFSLLRPVSVRAGWWVVASLIGWGLPAACVVVADSGVAAGDALRVGAIFFGGAMLGLVTGAFLVSILRDTGTGETRA